MTPLEAAILRTVIYADIFSFPLERRELHHYLIAEKPYSLNEVEHALATSILLRSELEFEGEHLYCAGRRSILAIHEQRDSASAHLWETALTYGHSLARLPFVRMVALTGALAVRNASDSDDDLDYVLVTAQGRVWLARAFAILLVRLAQRRGVVVCPNYVLAESALEQEIRDLFMAHEVAQMVPVYGHHVYHEMRARNAWVSERLPNATEPFFLEAERHPGRGWNWLKRGLEALFGGRLGNALENWEYQRKLKRFAAELKTPHHAALLDDTHVKGHFQDHGHPVMQQYEQRLRHYNLETELPLAGD